jgi:hypothetical protein
MQLCNLLLPTASRDASSLKSTLTNSSSIHKYHYSKTILSLIILIKKPNALTDFVCLSTLNAGSNPIRRKAAWSLYFCVVSYVGRSLAMGRFPLKFFQDF